jgi:hypothetical protein
MAKTTDADRYARLQATMARCVALSWDARRSAERCQREQQQRVDRALLADLNHSKMPAVKATSAKQILKAIGNENLSLLRGPGYWYFVYDDGRLYETYSVMTPYLCRGTLEDWVDEGRKFCRLVESKHDVPRAFSLDSSGYTRIPLSRREH